VTRSPCRYLIYGGDTSGLGCFRRCTQLATGIVHSWPDAEVLIVTGSPRAQSYPLPDRVDSLTLPSATRDHDGCHRPSAIMGDLGSLVRLRSSILLTVVSHFDPDVIVVDRLPVGLAGDFLPVLRCLENARRRPWLVLGLSDIVDTAKRVDQEWDACGVWEWIDRYDDILVYGDSAIETTASELRLADRVRGAVTHTGYVAPRMPEALVAQPFFLVTAGGGADGHVLMRAVLDAARAGVFAGFRVKIVTGPMMPPARKVELMIRAEREASIEIVEFADNMRQLVASAAGVISMAGYNTVVEEVAADVPALLAPRTTPSAEQNIRARRLSRVTRLERCSADRLTPDRVADFVLRCACGVRPSMDHPQLLDLTGVTTAARLLTGGRVGAMEPSVA
jgi:predicted glycosyltransferase